MNYEYHIAGIRIRLELPFEISVQNSSEAFLEKLVTDAADISDPDMRFVCRAVVQPPEPVTGGHEENNRCYIETDTDEGVRKSVYFRPSPTGAPYACVTWRASEPQILSCDYLVGQEYQWKYSMKICDMLGLESLLLHFDGLLLHSAFIRWQGQGILFSADSGVGKSTQADLWVKYQGAEILNGDRAGLRKLATVRPKNDDRETVVDRQENDDRTAESCRQGNVDRKMSVDMGKSVGSSADIREDKGDDETFVWTACGLPYAGSSRVYRNESAPVAAIFMLEQAPFNEVKTLTPAQALRKLYPQITIHSWDANFVQRVLPLLEDLVTSVPVYLLRCLPDEGAVEAARQELLRIRKKKAGIPADQEKGVKRP